MRRASSSTCGEPMTNMTSKSAVPGSKPKPRPRPQVMKLTEAAAQRIAELTRRADSEIVGLRVGIKNGGCAGQSYTVEYAHDIKPTDEVVEDKGVKILVDPKAVLFLLGTEMDYKVDKMSAQFIFNNPNQTGACGCGESVQLTAAKMDGWADRRIGARTCRLSERHGPRLPARLVFRLRAGDDPADVFGLRHFGRRHQLRAGAARGPLLSCRRPDD